MGKKGKNGRSTAFTQGSSFGLAYRDTVSFFVQPNDVTSTSSRDLSFSELLPGLRYNNPTARVIIPEHFIVEIQPDQIAPGSLSQEPMAQVQFLSGTRVDPTSGGGSPLVFEHDYVAQAPYKVLSKVNPTQMGFSVRAMARQLPTLLRTFDLSKEDESELRALRIVVAGLPIGSQGKGGVLVRVTSRVKIIPQLNLTDVPAPSAGGPNVSGKGVNPAS